MFGGADSLPIVNSLSIASILCIDKTSAIIIILVCNFCLDPFVILVAIMMNNRSNSFINYEQRTMVIHHNCYQKTLDSVSATSMRRSGTCRVH